MLQIVKKLDEGLFKSASTKEEYVNLATLESRLHALIKRPPLIIPTPGMPQSANSSLMATSSVDNSMVVSNNFNSSTASSIVTSGNLLPTANGPHWRSKRQFIESI